MSNGDDHHRVVRPTSIAGLPMSIRVMPWMTVAVALIVIGTHLMDQRDLLLYRRAGIAAGESWRLWTGHICTAVPSFTIAA